MGMHYALPEVMNYLAEETESPVGENRATLIGTSATNYNRAYKILMHKIVGN